MDSVVRFVNTYQLDGDLSDGQRYSASEQPGPDDFVVIHADETLPCVRKGNCHGFCILISLVIRVNLPHP